MVAALAMTPVACTPEVDTVAAEAALREAAEAFHAAAAARDRDAVVALFAPDAVMLPPDGERVEGADQVAEYPFGFIENPGVQIRFELVDVEISADGTIGWTVAFAHIEVHGPEGIEGRDLVRDVHTWRRGADGAWKITLDVWNSAPLPAS